MIPVPGMNENIPQHMYFSNLTRPKIQMKIDHTLRNRIADPNVEMYIAWFNELKKVNIEYKQRIDRFDATTKFTKDIGNRFLVGLNISINKDGYVFCEFNHEPVDGETEEDKFAKKRVPWLTTSSFRWQQTYVEELNVFQNQFADLHYNVAQDPAQTDTFYLYNPDTLIRIGVITPDERIEELYIRKRYTEALALSNEIYSNPYKDKIQNAYFNQLIMQGNTEKAKGLMV